MTDASDKEASIEVIETDEIEMLADTSEVESGIEIVKAIEEAITSDIIPPVVENNNNEDDDNTAAEVLELEKEDVIEEPEPESNQVQIFSIDFN